MPYNVKKDKGSKELQDFLKTHPEDKAKYEENERYNQWQAQAPSPIETTRIVSEKLNKFFDEKDVKFFKTKEGEVFGFTVGGKVYVDERIADASTPIHEYTHLWAEALRKVNPKEWQNIVSLMKKQTHLWDKVKNDYPELKTDDEIADEVLAHYSGERGKKLLDEEYKKIRGNNKMNIFDKAKMLQAINNVREALRKFWKGVADFLGIHFTSAEEVADKVLLDLLEGVNPNEVKNRDETYMKAVEKGDIETINKRFNDFLDRYKKGDLKRSDVMRFTDAGKMSQYLPNSKDIILKQSIINKAINKHNISIESLYDLPEKLENPILVFKSNRDDVDGVVVLVEAKDNMGNNITVAIDLNGKFNEIEVNDITSMYGKDSYAGYASWAVNILSGNMEKFKAWIESLPENDKRGVSKSMLSVLQEELQRVLLSSAKVEQNSETTKLKLQKVTERVVEEATDEALEEVKDPILKRAYKRILTETAKDKFYEKNINSLIQTSRGEYDIQNRLLYCQWQDNYLEYRLFGQMFYSFHRLQKDTCHQ